MAVQYIGKDSKVVPQPIVRRIEWESTVTIPVNETTYNAQKEKAKLDIIFFFDNDTRLSARRLERKTITQSRRLLNFYHNHWFPIKRTQATEDLCEIGPHANVVSAIHRLIVYNEEGLRVSYNKEECDSGVRYTVCYEIEYSSETTTYQHILLYERKLMAKLLEDNYDITRQTMTLENICECVMSKVQMWHLFDSTFDYIWAYKWNGIKAKLLITSQTLSNGSNLTYIWPDAKPVKTECATSCSLDILMNLCFLVEIMDDYIVIIEVIGTLIDKIYTTEPMMNASILKYLKYNISDLKISNKPVYIQEFYPAPMPSDYDKSKYDGFIVIQNDNVIKWKAPTIDVKCIEPQKYTVAGQTFTLEHLGVVGKIYEMSWTNKILRQRTDRIAASCEKEYDIFVKSTARLVEISKNNIV